MTADKSPLSEAVELISEVKHVLARFSVKVSRPPTYSAALQALHKLERARALVTECASTDPQPRSEDHLARVEGFIQHAVNGRGTARTAARRILAALSEPQASSSLQPTFNAWVDAEKLRHEKLAAYNARLLIVKAARVTGDWTGTTDLEYRAWGAAEQAEKDARQALSVVALAQTPREAGV